MMDLENRIRKIILDFVVVLIDNKKRQECRAGHLIQRMPCDKEKEYFFVPDLTHPHILRHTGCTRLGENNVNPKVMQYVMGHSDAKITMNIYNHIAEMTHVENEMSKMNLPETVPAVV